jgi:DNA-binding GntR family transcriptional regulator
MTKRACVAQSKRAALLSGGCPETAAHSRLRYRLIHDQLKSAIALGKIEPGLVLLEGPVARIFGTSRVPVRKAFEMLHAGGLLHTFEGRGYLVAYPDGSVPNPVRAPLNEAALGLNALPAPLNIPSNSERIYDALKKTISLSMVFGCFRINETLTAQHFGVSRSSIREALTRLRDIGIVEKSTYSHWLCGPLTARAVMHDYELRILLEPIALLASAPMLSRQRIEYALAKLTGMITEQDSVDATALSLLEADLHVDCLNCTPNKKLLATITGAHMPLTVNHAFFDMFNLHPDNTTLIEHREVLEALLRGDALEASAALRTHLANGQKRTLQRLKVLAVLTEQNLPAYMQRLA